ncbi:MAG: hypothetical protein QXU18_05705 [Thermoplasmatales archaeon]
MNDGDKSKFVCNARGLRAYRDPMRHELLEVSKIKLKSKKGAVYWVLSVGKFCNPYIPNVTIKERGIAILYRLPDWCL